MASPTWGEPILISTGGYIISGHRRRAASLLAGLTEVLVRITQSRAKTILRGFLRLLVEMNSQRVKATNELVHESLVKIDPKAAHQQIINERLEKSNSRNLDHLSSIDPGSDGRRCEISRAKIPLLDAVKRVLQEQHEYWPLSDR